MDINDPTEPQTPQSTSVGLTARGRVWIGLCLVLVLVVGAGLRLTFLIGPAGSDDMRYMRAAELIAAGEQEEVIEARRIAAGEARQRIQSDASDFVSECVTSLRVQTAQLCDDMLHSMKSGKTQGVHQKTLNRLVRFIDQFKAMNFADDHEMEQRLEQVRTEFLDRSAEDYRDSPAAQRDLESGLAAMRDHANDLLNQDAKELVERFGQLGRRKLQLAG